MGGLWRRYMNAFSSGDGMDRTMLGLVPFMWAFALASAFGLHMQLWLALVILGCFAGAILIYSIREMVTLGRFEAASKRARAAADRRIAELETEGDERD